VLVSESFVSLATAHYSLLIAHSAFSCYGSHMTITQTVDIPENHRLVIDVPREIPAGVTNVVIQFPINETSVKETVVKKRMSEAEEIEYFRLHADELNAEAEDVLSYQMPIFKDDDR
jgi:hypothetical protein